jgi:type IV secretory pathway VirB4 component
MNPTQQLGQIPISGPEPTVSTNVTSGQPATSSKTKKAATSNPNSTQNTLKIADIRDGIVIMEDGSFRSVVMVQSINFDLMSLEEQEAVEYSYQGFLNSLYFPIQIFMHSQRIDLQGYVDKLQNARNQQENMLLAMLMDDYINYIYNLTEQASIMDKKFYVVVPFFAVDSSQKPLSQSKDFFTGLGKLFSGKTPHIVIDETALAKGKEELRNRVQYVLSGLLQSNVQALPLDTQELIELYYDIYNPDTATQQRITDFSALTAKVVEKGGPINVPNNLKVETP